MKNIKLAIIIFTVLVSTATAAFALSWVQADGHVHSVTVTSSGIVYLKIERPDSTKVNADCMQSDEIRHKCEAALVGEVASGTARCVSGYCTWQNDLDIIAGSSVGGSINLED